MRGDLERDRGDPGRSHLRQRSLQIQRVRRGPDPRTRDTGDACLDGADQPSDMPRCREDRLEKPGRGGLAARAGNSQQHEVVAGPPVELGPHSRHGNTCIPNLHLGDSEIEWTFDDQGRRAGFDCGRGVLVAVVQKSRHAEEEVTFGHPARVERDAAHGDGPIACNRDQNIARSTRQRA